VRALVDSQRVGSGIQHGQADQLPQSRGGRGSLNHDPLQAGLQTDRAHGQKDGVRSGEPGSHGRGVIQANADGLQVRAVAEEPLGFPRIAHEHAHRSIGCDQPLDDRAADPPGGTDNGDGQERSSQASRFRD
jgi:hypothetical protein